MGTEGGRVVEGTKVREVNTVRERKAGFCRSLACPLLVAACATDIWFAVCFGNWLVFNCSPVLDSTMLDTVFF